MEREEIENIVRDILVDSIGYCDEDLAGMSFGKNVDSLTAIELVMGLEDKLDIEILNEEIENIKDAKQLVDHLYERKK